MQNIYYSLFLFFLIACGSRENQNMQTKEQQPEASAHSKGTFGYDLAFLKEHHKDLVLLHDSSNKAQLIVLPAYQGRVMTSTAAGDGGLSFGWLNYDLISSGKKAEHIHAFGGEERFWLGPEGGQFSIYFKKGDEFTYNNWLVPKEIDTQPFTLVGSSANEARFEKEMHLENYSGTKFDLLVTRNVRLLSSAKVDSLLGLQVPGDLEMVAFETENILTNKGTSPWTKTSGMLSVWILSMMNASDQTTVAAPFKQGDERKLGKVVTDDYFGKVPADRLKVTDRLILFKADGNYRSKIGISPERALPLIASYDGTNGILTVATFTLPEKHPGYVNSLWQIQKEPFKGDAVNSYNDGPVNGSQMGKLYEIESSSPAADLAPGKSLTHYHRTIHFKGSKEALDVVSMKLLGVPVDSLVL
jgi:hypothetical protein